MNTIGGAKTETSAFVRTPLTEILTSLNFNTIAFFQKLTASDVKESKGLQIHLPLSTNE